MRHGIGYVPEDRLTEGLFLQQSIGRNVVIRVVDETLDALLLPQPAQSCAIRSTPGLAS